MESYLIIVSPNSSLTAISDYGKRCGIETLFEMLREQSSPVVVRQRSKRTLCALCWAIKTGEWLHQHRPIKVKKHGRLVTKDLSACSIFCYGLDYLRSIVTDLDLKQSEFLQSLKFCPVLKVIIVNRNI